MPSSSTAVHRRARTPALLPVLALVLAACAGGGTASPETSSSPSVPVTSAAPAPSVPAGPQAQVTTALADLDRRAQVAQLFVAGVRLDDLDRGAALVDSGVGGVFLAGRSEIAATDLAATIAGWQSRTAGPGLWVAVDQEGGSVQTLKGPGFERLPSAVTQGDLPAEHLDALARGLGRALGDAGFNLDLAPVADVVPPDMEDTNEPIGSFDRHYGSTGPEVVRAAGVVVDGLAASGVTATLKHFPGLGRVTGNTDTRAVVVDDVTAADDDQVAAFAALAASPARPFVMASSATYSRIDPGNQAAFSRAVLTDLLRERLGFDGVVISDDLGEARAVRDIPVGERAVRFLAAGGTLVLTVDASSVPPMVDAVLARADADPAFAAVVDGAVRTALLAKAHAGLLPPA